jgi:phenylacetate-CoA ligase
VHAREQYWDSSIETLSPKELRHLQAERLSATLRAAMRSPFYKERYSGLKINPDRLDTPEAVRSLPFTTKADLRDGFPYAFLTVPLDEIVRLHSSSGTTGQITVVLHTKRDIDTWSDLVARCMYMAGMRRSDIFQNMMTYGLFTGGLGFHYGAERVGAMVLPVGAGNSRRQVFFLKTFGATVVHIIPSYALSLASLLESEGIDPARDLKLRIAFIGAEPHSEEVRGRIEELWRLKAFNSYGLSEMNGPGVAFECPEQNGMHLWEDAFYAEIVDPATGEPLPDGEEGELVLTTLAREGMPLLRYRTRDLTSFIPEPCPCGRTHRRITRIKGRADDMIIVKGVNIFPIQIETALMRLPEVGRNYRILLTREGYRDEMVVQVEVLPELFRGQMKNLQGLRERITGILRDEILVTPKVELVEPGTIEVSEGKAVRVIDKRTT